MREVLHGVCGVLCGMGGWVSDVVCCICVGVLCVG